MIRYVHIGNQINEGADEFAFFDTVRGRFIDIDGQQVFESRADVIEALMAAQSPIPVARLLDLLPPHGGVVEAAMDRIDAVYPAVVRA